MENAPVTESLFAGTSLCVVGNVNRDIKTSPFNARANLFEDGETAVDSIIETIGGGGANSALAAAALGARVTFLGKVGDDALGSRLERTLRQYQIDARLPKDPTHATGTSLALSFSTGHRHFISSLPANRALAFADLDLAPLGECNHLLRADIWFSDSMLFEGNKALFEAARKMSVPVSIDLNWDPQWGVAGAGEIRARKQAVRDVLPWIALAHGNVRELIEFSGARDLESALKAITDWGAGAIVVHMGPRGAGYFSNGSLVVEPPAAVSKHINTTGTGDVLSVCAILLHGRTQFPITRRLRLANEIVAEFIEGRRTLIPALCD